MQTGTWTKRAAEISGRRQIDRLPVTQELSGVIFLSSLSACGKSALTCDVTAALDYEVRCSGGASHGCLALSSTVWTINLGRAILVDFFKAPGIVVVVKAHGVRHRYGSKVTHFKLLSFSIGIFGLSLALKGQYLGDQQLGIAGLEAGSMPAPGSMSRFRFITGIPTSRFTVPREIRH
jgi:hypothetical protein